MLIRRSQPHNTSEPGPTKSGRERPIPLSHGLHDALRRVRDLRHLQGGLLFGRRRDGQAISLYAVTERLHRGAPGRPARDPLARLSSQLRLSARLHGSAVPPGSRVDGPSSIVTTMRYSHLSPGGGAAIHALDGGGQEVATSEKAPGTGMIPRASK